MSDAPPPERLCAVLPWDSQFFGFRVARVLDHRLDPLRASAIVAWCQREQIRCVYFLADAHDPSTVTSAEEAGFHLKDIRLTYSRALDSALKDEVIGLPPGVCIRPARLDDAPLLEALTDGSYTDSRFYFDQHFDPAAATRLYRVWIRQSVEGQADGVLVLEYAGRPCGFVTCHLLGHAQGECRLVGIDARLRGQGLGKVLTYSALQWFARHDVQRVSYVTQGRNLRAQRLVQGLGFSSTAIQLWYHRWFESRLQAAA